MPDMVHVQLTQANAYLAELIGQFSNIEQRIEKGETVTLNLTEGGRGIALLVNREKVVERAAPVTLSSGSLSARFPDNKSLVAAVTNTFTFDIGEANRKISPADVQVHVLSAAQHTKAAAAGRLGSDLPDPAVTYDGRDWILAGDCRYVALDGFAITARSGFRSDLASIPRLLWALIASFELSLVAPIMHDLIYRSGGRVALPQGLVEPPDRTFLRKEADDLFLELMTRAKISYWKRNVAYLAVRAFGQSSWHEGEALSHGAR